MFQHEGEWWGWRKPSITSKHKKEGRWVAESLHLTFQHERGWWGWRKPSVTLKHEKDNARVWWYDEATAIIITLNLKAREMPL